MKTTDLPLPDKRCLSKKEAASYLGIGTTLLAELRIPAVKLGRRLVYDKVDLDLWLEEYKRGEQRRVGKDLLWTNPKTAFLDAPTPGIGGSTPPYQMDKEYARVLGLKTKPRR